MLVKWAEFRRDWQAEEVSGGRSYLPQRGREAEGAEIEFGCVIEPVGLWIWQRNGLSSGGRLKSRVLTTNHTLMRHS